MLQIYQRTEIRDSYRCGNVNRTAEIIKIVGSDHSRQLGIHFFFVYKLRPDGGQVNVTNERIRVRGARTRPAPINALAR